jgi:hypothetical protein
MINFGFNTKSQQYHYLNGDKKGQFVAKSKVREIVAGYINEYKQDFETLTTFLAEGRITLNEWETKTAKIIKEITIATLKVAKPDANSQDYGTVGAQLKKQYLYLRNFSREIAQGQLSAAQINARANQYLHSVWTFYNSQTRDSHKQAGYNWERRLQQSKHPCKQCPKYAALGWQIIGTLPKIGEQCDCKQNCRCYFDFSRSTGKPQESLSFSFFSDNQFISHSKGFYGLR